MFIEEPKVKEENGNSEERGSPPKQELNWKYKIQTQSNFKI